jgi:hypothetical protein
MKTIELEQMGVQEMNANEIQSFNGGWGWIFPAVMLGIYLYDNRDRVIEGFNKGLNEEGL